MTLGNPEVKENKASFRTVSDGNPIQKTNSTYSQLGDDLTAYCRSSSQNEAELKKKKGEKVGRYSVADYAANAALRTAEEKVWK